MTALNKVKKQKSKKQKEVGDKITFLFKIRYFLFIKMSDCFKKLNNFCYVCGKFTAMPQKNKISDQLAEIYEEYFNLAVIQNVDWVPQIVCGSCRSILYGWINGRRKGFKFGVPMIWTEPINHETNKCYVCINNFTGLNRLKAIGDVYQSAPSAQTPLSHSDAVPVPKRPSPTEAYAPETFRTSAESSMSLYQPSTISQKCNHIEITQQRFDRMVRQLKLSQRRSIVLGQHLSAVNILEKGVKIYSSRGRQREFLQFFNVNENNSLAYCNDVGGLMLAMNYTYKAEDWRLFIDGSKTSLKAVLLYKDNSNNPVPVALAVNTKESYDSMKTIIESLKYKDHMWKICADLKVVALLSGLQTGYTKNMCFMCLWNSRYKDTSQYQKRDWAMRKVHAVGVNNILHENLVPIEKILLPPLHIKLGIVKNFIKALITRQNEQAFNQLQYIFPRLSKNKIKEGNNFYESLKFVKSQLKCSIVYFFQAC